MRKRKLSFSVEKCRIETEEGKIVVKRGQRFNKEIKEEMKNI
jgi:hypothetical protein